MILELDCGNSLIKWRILDGARQCLVVSGVVGSSEQLIECLSDLTGVVLSSGRMTSVRSDINTYSLSSLIAERFSICMSIARASKELAGVKNGYFEPELLGCDRWLALVAAFRLSGRACLVLDLGTAVTADFVGCDGQHLGGKIAPGMAMMSRLLSENTQRIGEVNDQFSEQDRSLLGRSTFQAVSSGCLSMLRGFVSAQYSLAKEYWGLDFDVYLTGGDAGLVGVSLPGAIVVPDLIFRGLALACPIEGS